MKFAKAMCETCNNARSKPLDKAYGTFSTYVSKNQDLRLRPGVDFLEVFGEENWEVWARDLARYYAKHFASRVVDARFPVPASLRSFLDDEVDPPDLSMILITTDSVRRNERLGFYFGPETWRYSGEPLRITRHIHELHRGFGGALPMGRGGPPLRQAVTVPSLPDARHQLLQGRRRGVQRHPAPPQVAGPLPPMAQPASGLAGERDGTGRDRFPDPPRREMTAVSAMNFAAATDEEPPASSARRGRVGKRPRRRLIGLSVAPIPVTSRWTLSDVGHLQRELCRSERQR